jgi:hypothetical protein
MTRPDRVPLDADVLLDPHVPADQERMLVDALARLDVLAQVRIVPTRRGLGDLHWLVLVALPLQAFLSGMGSKLAEDAYQGFKGAVGRLLGRGGQTTQVAGRARPLVLQDTATGLQVVLEPDLPDDGYQRLLGLDLAGFQGGGRELPRGYLLLRYDRRRGRWLSSPGEPDPAGPGS